MEMVQSVAKAVHDRVSGSTSTGDPRTMHCTNLEGPLNCLCLNKDSSQVVAAGRNVFKVFSIHDDAFMEKINLRVGRTNLNYSACDVAWNQTDDNIIASAATNGAVVIWDLNKTSRSKQDIVFTEHKRHVNRICFHANESNLLLSGSQDGSMKLFDLRTKSVNSTFNTKSESVRDVQYNPHHYFNFAGAFENGDIQIWDMRNPSRWERQFTAHNGPVFCIDWHPDEKHWIATGGRDKVIKVWDLQNPAKAKNSHSVQTIASVSRIKWRPQRKYHITSCALLLDFSISVWDIRRPFIPFAAFNQHKDVVTGICWKHNDPHLFLSSSKDQTLYQHMFKDATRPADNANPTGIDISSGGCVAHVSSEKLGNHSGSRPSGHSTPRLPNIFRRNTDRSEQFTMVTSMLHEFENSEDILSMGWFVESAKKYKLKGRSLNEICDHNANVALKLDRHHEAQTWMMLKLLYNTAPSTPANASKSISGIASKVETHKEPETDKGKSVHIDLKQHQEPRNSTDVEKFTGDTSTGLSEEESEFEMEKGTNLTTIASGMGNHQSDFFFGDGELCPFDEDPLSALTNGQDWHMELPNEAFNPRHEILEKTAEPELQQNGIESPSSANESEFSSNVPNTAAAERTIKQEILFAPPFLSEIPTWNFTKLVCDMLHTYAEHGDVQMAVTVMIALGNKIRPHIDDTDQEQWFMSYIDLLSRFRLWSIATEVINLSNHPAVGAMNQQSTKIDTTCSKCLKPLQRTGWLCDKCKEVINTCVICHHPVKGLYVWCQGCSHGGHLEHIREWMKQSHVCPSGCGHLCEYT